MQRTRSSSFGGVLKRARLAAGLTQEELAERSGISVRTIGNLERGGPHRPRKDTRHLLAGGLGLTSLDEAQPAENGSVADPATPADAREAPARHLPIPPTPLIGREQDVQAACMLLRRPEVRLLTLCGPPGVGKTRLGLAVAEQLQQDFADGAVFVPLAPISAPSLVAATMAQTLRLPKSSVDALTEYLQQQSLLLLLDNFEQVASAAPLIADLLATCPQIKILVTSRVVAHVRGEQEFPLLPLALPDLAALPPLEALARVPSVALLLQRAQAALPSFALTAANASAVAGICHRLDGVPLALELAAARLKLFSPQALLAQLEQRRLSLTGGAHDLPRRQQALRDTLAWSYALLQAGEQALFRRLGVFVGGCPLEAVAPVCAAADPLALDVLEGLAALLDHFLLRREDVAGSGEVRLGMLEMLREYALEQLQAHGEVAATQREHAHYYLALAEAAYPELIGKQQVIWFARLEREHENLRAALRWARDSAELEVGLRLVGVLWRFWYTRGHLAEGRAWLKAFLDLTKEGVSAELAFTRARALKGAGTLAAQQSDYEQATVFHTEALALCRTLGNRRGVAVVLSDLAIVALGQGEYMRAGALFEESLALYRALGDTQDIAIAGHNLGILAYRRGQYTQAARLFEESLALRRQLRDTRGIASTLSSWGDLARDQGQYPFASALLEESLALYRDLGEQQSIAIALCNLGAIAYDRGDLERAGVLGTEALHLLREVGEVWFYPDFLTLLGKVAYKQGAYGRAAALHEESLSLRQSMRESPGIAESLANLAYVAQAQGDDARATALYQESLGMYQTLRIRHGLAPCLDGWAHLLLAQGRALAAARLLGATAALREEIGAPLPPIEQAAHARLLAGLRQALGEGPFTAVWAAGRAMTVEELLAEAPLTARPDALPPAAHAGRPAPLPRGSRDPA